MYQCKTVIKNVWVLCGKINITFGIVYLLVVMQAHISSRRFCGQVLTYLRKCGLRLALYVDDFFLTACQSVIEDHKKVLTDTLSNLGWKIDFKKKKKKKIVPKPLNEQGLIGYVISSNQFNGQPGIRILKNNTKLKKDISRVLKKRQAPARHLTRIAGQCVAMEEVILPSKMLLRMCFA